mmetsp:Transcript_2995/g.7801  ORF Transcript_2995/g.7801 Transcript_2995/m.7801 type:complete len:185 (-) Transcript_2995:330-884(-)
MPTMFPYHDPAPSSQLRRVWSAFISMPTVVLMGTFSLLCAWSLTSLTCFHAVIITAAQTTNERVRGVYRYGGAVNTADRGCPYNWYGALCGRRPSSRLPRNFSEVVRCIPASNEVEEEDGDADGGEGGGERRGGAPEESVWDGGERFHVPPARASVAAAVPRQPSSSSLQASAGTNGVPGAATD